jgi:hypothetical protein
MNSSLLVLARTLALASCLTFAAAASATDRDGGNDCLNTIVDWGDAPEGVLAYPGVTGRFPTCRQMNLVGTRDVPPGCPPLSTPPGITGHIFHRPSETGAPYWLGCYSDANGLPMGIERDSEGKVNQPAVGFSVCDQRTTDCVETAYGLTFDQDECFADGSDAGVTSVLDFPTCQASAVTFTTSSCAAAPRVVVLNILVDLNHDGDWNDAVLCGTACAPEWVVKNLPITLPPGCGTLTSPAFLAGPTPGPSWVRISLSDGPIDDDYPWAGGAGEGGIAGGETEDYPGAIQQAVPAVPSTWGSVKASYR